MRCFGLALALVACAKQDTAEGKACEAGDGEACFAAATRFDIDDRTELERAIEYWTRGCELGHGKSCAQLGTVIEHGFGGRGTRRRAAMLPTSAPPSPNSCHPGKPSAARR